MAIVYLANGDQVDIYDAGRIHGAAGRERVMIHPEARNVIVSSAVEELHFALDSSRHEFAAVSGRLEIRLDGDPVATHTAADGLEARFADGGAVLAVDPATGGISLGGRLLDTRPAPFQGALNPDMASALAPNPPAPTPDPDPEPDPEPNPPAPAPDPGPGPNPEPDPVPDPVDPSIPDRLEANDTAPSATSLVGIRAGALDGLTLHAATDADFFKIHLDSPGTADNFVRIGFDDPAFLNGGARVAISDGMGHDLDIVAREAAASATFALEGLEAGTYVVRVEAAGGSPASYALAWNTEGVSSPVARRPDVGTARFSEFAVAGGRALVVGMDGLDAGMFDVFSNGDADGDGHDDVDGTGPSLVDPRVVDAEKGSDPLGPDADMCWAAAAANALALTGWGELGLETAGLRDASIPLEDDILDLFRENHDPGSGFEYQAVEWFFDETGLSMTGLSYAERDAGQDAMAAIEAALRAGRAVTLGIRGRLGGTGLNHAVTCCGILWDESADAADPGRFTGICIVDSDDDRSHANPADAPNRLTLVDCSYDAARGRWFLDTYAQRQVVGSGVMLESVTEINAWPGQDAVPALGVPDAA